MQYRADKLENGFWVVRDTNNSPVSEKFRNKSQALAEALRLNAPPVTKTEPVEAPVQQATPVALAEIPSRFVGRAVGIYQGTDGAWVVASIPFDPSTKETFSTWKEDRAGMNKIEGHGLFKVVAAKEILSR